MPKLFVAHFRNRLNGTLNDVFRDIEAASLAQAKKIARNLEGMDDLRWLISVEKKREV